DAAVGVDDDLPAGEPGVGHRAALHEGSGGVDVVADRLLSVDVALRQHRVDHVTPDVALDGRVLDAGGVLARHHHRVDPHRTAVVVLDRDLGLAVGTQVGNQPPATRIGEA